MPSGKIVKLSRTYTKAKSFPLTKTAIQVSTLVIGPLSPFVAVFYQAATIAEKDEVSCHGNINGSNAATSDPEYIKTISCICHSYYIFLGTAIQLDGVVKLCCDSYNVLCIETTLNLCSNRVTDCYFRTNEGKHPIFLGPAIIHFEKDMFLFSLFASEMQIHQPAISNLKTIATDLEKVIFNGFLCQIKDLKLLLYLFHLQQNDKRKLLELKPKGGSQAINWLFVIVKSYGKVNFKEIIVIIIIMMIIIIIQIIQFLLISTAVNTAP